MAFAQLQVGVWLMISPERFLPGPALKPHTHNGPRPVEDWPSLVNCAVKEAGRSPQENAIYKLILETG